MRLSRRTEARFLLCALLLGVVAVRAEPTYLLFETGKAEDSPELVLGNWEKKSTGLTVLREEGGAFREVKDERVLARLPASPLAEDSVTREAAVAAISALLEAKAKAPALEKALQEEVEKWKDRLDKIPSEDDPAALAKAETAYVAAVAGAAPKPYEPGGNYSAEKVEEQIAALELLKNEFVGRTEEINLLLAPWLTEKAELALGKKKFEGRWLNPEEWEQQKGERERVGRIAFLQKYQLPEVSAVLLGQTLLLGSLAMGLLTALLGVSFFFHGMIEIFRHRAWWKGSAWMLAGIVAVGFLGRATGLLLAPPDSRMLEQEKKTEALEDLIWQTAGQKRPMEGETRLGAGELNAWWQQRLRFTRLAVTEIVVLSTERWQIQFLKGGVRLDRVGHLLGRSFVLRHELSLTRTEGGEDLYRIEATLGKLPLPPSFALWSWEAWIADVAKIAQALPGADGQGVERLEDGYVVLQKK